MTRRRVFAWLGLLLTLAMCVAADSVSLAQIATPSGPPPAPAKGRPLGQFDSHRDIGAPKIAGNATYEAATHGYTVAAGGANMFHDHDEFHFVWRKVTGNFVIGARVKFVGSGAEAHRKAGLMARSSLDAGAAYVDGVVHGQGPTALQTRRTNGADTEMMVTAAPTEASPNVSSTAAQDTDYVQLERRDNVYIVTIAPWGKPVTQQAISGIDLGAEVYLGLFLCAHNADVKENAIFTYVHIEQTASAARKKTG